MANRESDVTITNEESGDEQDADVTTIFIIHYHKKKLVIFFFLWLGS